MLQIKNFVLGLTASLALTALHGATVTWNAELNTNFWGDLRIGSSGDNSNWSNNSDPGINDEARFNDGSLARQIRDIELTTARAADRLRFISAASGYTLDAVNERNQLTLNSGVIAVEDGDHTIHSNLVIGANASWSISSGDSLTVSGSINGAFDISKTGNGSLFFAPTATVFANSITASSGSIEIQGINALQNTVLNLSGGSVSYNTSGTAQLAELTGSGSIALGGDPINITTVSPGSTSIGTLTLDNDTIISGTYECDLSTDTRDRIAVTGNLDISGATLDIAVNELTFFPQTIATYTSLTGTFASIPAEVVIENSGTSLTVSKNTRFYVNPDNTGTQDGLSWATGFTKLQDALAVVGDGAEVWVKQGIYYPDEGSNQTNNNRNATFSIGGGVAVLGGFNGTETSANQRDPITNLTILSGDITQNDTTNTDGVTESADDIEGNNAYSVVTIDYGFNDVFVTETHVDGFIITAGHCTVVGESSTGRGGGLYVASSGVGGIPVIENCRIYGNHAYDGGGYFVGNDAYCTFISCDIRGNRADRDGGGGATSYAQIFMINSNISGNISGRNGGGILDSLRSYTATYINCTIAGNYAGDRWGGYDSPTGWNRVTMQNVLFWNNLESRGGRSIDSFFATRYTFENCLFQDTDLTGRDPASLNGTLATNNPLFLDPIDVSNLTSPTLDGDYRLSMSSPVLDIGKNSLISQTEDVSGSPRIVDSIVDLGAYELDKVAPFLVLAGDNPQEVEVDDSASYNDPFGTIATDDEDGDITDQIIATGDIDMGVPDTYTRTYTVSDATGNTTQLTRTVNLVDTTDPSIQAPADILNVEITSPSGNAISLGSSTVSDNAFAAPTVSNNAGGIQNFGSADIRQATIVNNGAIGVLNGIDGNTTVGNSAIVDHTTSDIAGSFNSLGSNFVASVQVTADLDASDLNYSNTGTSDSSDLFTQPNASAIFFIADTSPLYNAGDSANIPADVDDADGDNDTVEPAPFPHQYNNDHLRVEEGQVDIGAYEHSVEPRIIASVPARNSTAIDPRSSIAFTFNQPVFPGTGTIEFRDDFTDNLIVSYDVNGSEVNFSGSTVEIIPDTTLLPDGYNFYLEIGPGVILDETGDDFSGTSDEWEYTSCALNVYLNTPDGWGLGTFSSKVNGDTGLEVTWNGGNDATVTGLSFNFNAFVSIEAAMEAACDGATLHFAAGTWNDLWDPEPVDITKAVTFVGAGLGQNFIVNNFDGDALNILVPGVTISGITVLDDPFSRWVQTYYPGETDPEIIGFDADPYSVGITNGVAFLTATDPAIAAPGARPQIESSNGVLTFIMRFNTEAGYPVVDYSDNLIDWSLASDPADVHGLTYTRETDGFEPGVDKLTIRVDTSVFFDDKFFIRQELALP